ncbi:M61 family metallopeptidase [Leptothermofonsia sichuanensis E412]|uniref:M61 family metallopeptidase n=1 Tax=Leptothermofonsia sichuanensis TaxID=2917832 RepID=UPI001CA668F5|nr:M61 family metallopeptidase [Leptothermofonsia sichuanensis]QZZ21501.1 M61 family metallopeptidase [Leptothermofonsia sichuanensis E412]
MHQEELEFERGLETNDVQPLESYLQPDHDPDLSTRLRSAPQIHYQVAMPAPQTHLFEVTLQIINWQADQPRLDLKMPVWTPGSYLVREYSRHLQNFAAFAGEHRVPLSWRKLSKNHWQIELQGQTALTVTYRIFANELTVRTNHLDETHGYFNGAALFFYIPGYERCPVRVAIAPPDSTWKIATALPPVADSPNTFLAKDFDTLVDSPFEVGIHQTYEFEVQGKPHRLVVWGEGNLEPERLITDIQKVIGAEAGLFGGLPYDRYLFLLHLSSQGFGGLEHRDSCSLIYQRFGFRNQDRYNRFIQLVAHEFFHLWNVKRIRPKAFEVFDYEQENYTPSLWFSEGTTSFYDLIFPYRAGIYDLRAYLNALSKEITRYLTTPGRRVQPLSESSFDAWIKLYRQDANSPNSQMSYYLKGEMVSLLLDLLIRERHGNWRSLDDVMRQMWERFGKPEIGFTPGDLQQVIESVAGTDLSDFFAKYLDGLDELPFDTYLNPFGLGLQADLHGEAPYLGLHMKLEHGRELIKFVESASPAQNAGLDAGDELLALNGIRVSGEHLNERLRDYNPGDTIRLTVFHQDELCTRAVTLAEPRPTRYQIVPLEQPTAIQEQNFRGWLGRSLAEVNG